MTRSIYVYVGIIEDPDSGEYMTVSGTIQASGDEDAEYAALHEMKEDFNMADDGDGPKLEALYGPYLLAPDEDIRPAKTAAEDLLLNDGVETLIQRGLETMGADGGTPEEQADNILAYIGEDLTGPEWSEVEAFLTWALTDWDSRGFGWGNYADRAVQYAKEKE